MPTIRLTWTNNSALHDSIEVQQDGITIATLPAGTTSHDVSTAVTPGVPIEFRVRCHSDGPNRDSDWIITTYTPANAAALYKDSTGAAVTTPAAGTVRGDAYGDAFTSLGAALLPDAPATTDGPLPPFAVSFVVQLTGTMLEWGDIVLLHAPAADANDEFKVVLSREPIGFGVVFKAGTRQVMAGYTRPGLVSFDRPMHVAVTYDNTTVRVFLNGALIGSAALALNMVSLQRLRVSLERLSGGGFNASFMAIDSATGDTWARTPAGDFISGHSMVESGRIGRFIVFHPMQHRWFCAGDDGVLWQADPHGAWQLGSHNLTGSLYVYSMEYDSVRDCWWACAGNGSYLLFRISSDLTVWTQVLTLGAPDPIAVCVHAGTVLVGGGANSGSAAWIRRSTDDGVTWDVVMSGGGFYVERIIRNENGIFGALDFTGLLLSNDGITWTREATLPEGPWSAPGLAFFANSWWAATAVGGVATKWYRTAPGATDTLTQVASAAVYGWSDLLVVGDRLLGCAAGPGQSREWDLAGNEYAVAAPVAIVRLRAGDAPVPAVPSQVTVVPPSQRGSADVVAPVGSGAVEVLDERQFGGLRSDLTYQVDLALAGTEVPGPTVGGVSGRWVRFTVIEDHGNGGSPSGWIFNEIEAWSGLNRTGENKALGRPVTFVNPYPYMDTYWTGAAATDGDTAQDDSVMHYAGTGATIGSSVTVDLGAIQVLRSFAAFNHPTYIRPRIRIAVSENNSDWTDVGELNWPTSDATRLKQVDASSALVTTFTVVALDAAGQPATEGLGTSSGVLTSGSLVAANSPTGTFAFFVRGDQTWRLEGYREACGFEVNATYQATPVVPAGTVPSNLTLPPFTFDAGYLSRVWMSEAEVAALSDQQIGAPAADFVARANGVLLSMPAEAPYAIEGFNKSDGVTAATASAICRAGLRWLVMGGTRVAATETGCRTWSVETFPAEVLAVTFDDDRAFAILSTGDLYMSSDAERLAWTLLAAVPKSLSEVPVGLAAGNGALVVLLHTPGSGVVFLAMDLSDPLNWNRTERGENWPLAITFGMGRFVAVGSNVAWTSVDAVTWGAAAVGDTLRSVACDGARFAAAGAVPGLAYTSLDGVTWDTEPLLVGDSETRSVGVSVSGDLVIGGASNRFRRELIGQWAAEPVAGTGAILAVPNTLQPAPAGRWLNIRARQTVQTGPRLAWSITTDRYAWTAAITRSNAVLLLAACSDVPPASQFTLTKVDEYDFIARIFLPAGATQLTVKAGFITIEAQPLTEGTVTVWWDGEAEPGSPTATTQVPYPPQYGTECEVATLMLQRNAGPWWTLSAVAVTPVITSALSLTVEWGQAFTYTITANNLPTGFGATGLPDTVSRTGAVISGRFFPDTITVDFGNTVVRNSYGIADWAIGVQTLYRYTGAGASPDYVTYTNAAGALGVAVGNALHYAGLNFSLLDNALTHAFAVTALLNNPPDVSSFNVSSYHWINWHRAVPTDRVAGAFGVPTNSGFANGGSTIAGSVAPVTASGAAASVGISATNAAGTDNETLVLTGTAPLAPFITSALTAGLSWGEVFSYQITADNAPTSFDAVGSAPTYDPSAALALAATAPIWLKGEDYVPGSGELWHNSGTLGSLGLGSVGPALAAPDPAYGVLFPGNRGLRGDAVPAYANTTTFMVFHPLSNAGYMSPLALKWGGSSNPTTQHWAPSYLLNYPVTNSITCIGGGGPFSSHYEIRAAGGLPSGAINRNILAAYSYTGDAPTWGSVDGVDCDVSYKPFGSSTGQTNTAGSVISIALGYDFLGDNGYFNGYIAEIVIFNRILSLAERDTINAYLKNKWGIA